MCIHFREAGCTLKEIILLTGEKNQHETGGTLLSTGHRPTVICCWKTKEPLLSHEQKLVFMRSDLYEVGRGMEDNTSFRVDRPKHKGQVDIRTNYPVLPLLSCHNRTQRRLSLGLLLLRERRGFPAESRLGR